MSFIRSGNVCREVPVLSESITQQMLLNAYGLSDVSIRQLEGWVDKNYLITTIDKTGSLKDSLGRETRQDKFVLKVLNSTESKEDGYIDALNTTMLHLSSEGFPCCTPLPSKSGKYNTYWRIEPDVCQQVDAPTMETTEQRREESPNVYLARLFRYIEGVDLDSDGVNPSNTTLVQLGCFLANVNLHMQPCSENPGFGSRKPSIWHLNSVPQLEEFLEDIQEDLDPKIRQIIRNILKDFQEKVVPFYTHFQQGLIHGDCSPANLLLREGLTQIDGFSNDFKDTFGIIDFGETEFSYFIFELAIAMCQFMPLAKRHHLSVQNILRGYNSVIALNEFELAAVKSCVGARAAQLFILTCWYDDRKVAHGGQPVDHRQDPFYQLLLNMTDFDDK